MSVKDWYSAAELAGLGLPGFPVTKKGVLQLVDRERWPSKKREGKGGGFEYQPTKSIMNLIREKTLSAMVSGALKVEKSTDIVLTKTTLMPTERLSQTGAVIIAGLNRRAKHDGDLTTKDRERRDASLILCRAIDEAIAVSSWKARRVIMDLSQRLFNGQASQELVNAANITYTKPRASGQTYAALVSRLQKMYSAYEKGRTEGDVSMYLVPGQRQKEEYPAFLIKGFLIHYCHPNRPPIMTAWRNSQSWFDDHGFERPAVDTFYRIEKSLPVTVKNRGRVTGSEWRGMLPYVARDVTMFKSNDIWVGDGHSFKAKVQHPIHGRPFVPEITIIRDWVSRKIVGWSVDMAESCIAVSAALRDSMLRTQARPLVYYSDNGSGQTAKQLDHEVHGVLARMGIAHETGIPGNPQGRGIIERLWSDTFIALARTYPTFQGKSGDENSINKMLKDLNRKEPKTLLPTWNNFLVDVAKTVEEYNARIHSVIENTPNQHYLDKLDADSIDIGITPQELASLWMPQVERVPQRGLIELFRNEYAMPELVNLLAEGERVAVRFDIHRPDKVLVFRLNGNYLGEAIWDGHKRSAFPISFMDHKREERVLRKVDKKQREIAEARQELGNTVDSEATKIFVIPPQAKPDVLVAPVIPRREKQEEMSYLDVQRMIRQQGNNNDTDEVAVG